MKRYEQIKPTELTEIEFANLMGKLLGHALVGPRHAAMASAGCVTIAAQCRVFTKNDDSVVIEEWDKKVELDSRYMLKNAIKMQEDGDDPPEEPVDLFTEKDVTDEEILSIAGSLQSAIAVMLVIGTSGAIPNLLTASVLKGIEHRLKESAAHNGMDPVDWHRQVANAEGRIAVVAISAATEMPDGTVMSKGGDA